MTDQERYLFDLQGYIQIPDALNKAEVDTLNRLWDKHIEEEAEPDMRTQQFAPMAWERPFIDLMDHESIYHFMEELLGPGLRLDMAQAYVVRAGKGVTGLEPHGGGTPFMPTTYYHFHAGTMYNGLMAVGFFLNDVKPGDGGFACVPGSHKCNYPLPGEWNDPGNLPPIFQQLHGPAGTAIVFTEALTHIGLPWQGEVERRDIFNRYSPCCQAWAALYYNPDDFDHLSDRQRAMLEPPNARNPERLKHLAHSMPPVDKSRREVKVD